MTREEVIKRLESAIEGCREFDAHIAALNWPNGAAYFVNDGDRPSDVDAGEWLVLRRTGDGRVARHRPPCYSTSVDAALSLVPKGMGWQVQYRRREHTHVAGIAESRNPQTGHHERFTGHAKTAALAICSAALRAREVIEGK